MIGVIKRLLLDCCGCRCGHHLPMLMLVRVAFFLHFGDLARQLLFLPAERCDLLLLRGGLSPSFSIFVISIVNLSIVISAVIFIVRVFFRAVAAKDGRWRGSRPD